MDVLRQHHRLRDLGRAGVTIAGDHYPFNLMLLAIGGIMQENIDKAGGAVKRGIDGV